MASKILFRTMDEYIASVNEPHRSMLQTLRQAIRTAAPEAVETISYNMPAFRINSKILVYFAAHTNHIGFYPADTSVFGIFQQELEKYHTSKGTIQFQVHSKVPVALVRKIVKVRAGNIEMKIAMKAKNKAQGPGSRRSL